MGIRVRPARRAVLEASKSRTVSWQLARGFERAAHRVGGAIFVALVLVSGLALAAPQFLVAQMTGGQETPANSSTATGTCSANVDPATLRVSFSGSFTGLAAQASAASLRGLAGAGAVGPVLLSQTSLAAGVSGNFSGSGTLTSAQVAGMLAGDIYCEMDDAAFPSGEIRGQLTLPSVVPTLTPEALAGLGALLGCAGVALQRIRARFPPRRAPDA
jgi:hypothetical protein